MGNFKDDLKRGEEGELIVRTYLESKGATYHSDNKNNTHDLIMSFNEELISYEIKTNYYVNKDRDSNNIFVEFECRGKASGIDVSKAKWFATYFFNLGEIWFIEVDKLKELIEEYTFKTTTLSGDYNSNTKGYLVPRFLFVEHFLVKYL
jgi:hypothetical protein